ncbi:MAG: gluconate 2-dehydrogenase subunit 3 family protein [Terriglobales bacterium]
MKNHEMKNHELEVQLSAPGQKSVPHISRRDLIRAALLAGTSAALGPVFSFAQAAGSELTPAQRGVDESKELVGPDWKPAFLDEGQNETLIALSDVIIPATDTPGAKEALVNRYLDLVLAGEPAELQQKFLGSLSYVDSESLRLFGKEFRALTPEDQHDLLQPLAYPLRTSVWHNKDIPDPGVEHFDRLKAMIAVAYYSSEIGQDELGWDGSFTHGPFQGCEHSTTTHK